MQVREANRIPYSLNAKRPSWGQPHWYWLSVAHSTLVAQVCSFRYQMWSYTAPQPCCGGSNPQTKQRKIGTDVSSGRIFLKQKKKKKKKNFMSLFEHISIWIRRQAEGGQECSTDRSQGREDAKAKRGNELIAHSLSGCAIGKGSLAVCDSLFISFIFSDLSTLTPAQFSVDCRGHQGFGATPV